MARIILREDEVGLDPHLAFNLKEATYKAWSTLGGPLIDHHDVRIAAETETFRAHVVAEDIWFSGSFAKVQGCWLSLVVV